MASKKTTADKIAAIDEKHESAERFIPPEAEEVKMLEFKLTSYGKLFQVLNETGLPFTQCMDDSGGLTIVLPARRLRFDSKGKYIG